MTYYIQQPRKRERDDEPVRYSIAHIMFIDGTETEFMVKASPNVVPSLTKEMQSSGFLTLWNDTDTMCARADQIKHFSMREVTKE
jgi:hypothetical protein